MQEGFFQSSVFELLPHFQPSMLVPAPCKGGVNVRINSVKNTRHTDAAKTEALYIPIYGRGGVQTADFLVELYAFCSAHKRKECNQKP